MWRASFPRQTKVVLKQQTVPKRTSKVTHRWMTRRRKTRIRLKIIRMRLKKWETLPAVRKEAKMMKERKTTVACRSTIRSTAVTPLTGSTRSAC